MNIGKEDGGKIEPKEMAFFTFCWRGDFKETSFSLAEATAGLSAPSLTSFLLDLQTRLSSIHSRREDYSIILISHSLGARVVLEALRNLGETHSEPLADCLLMLQPAVAVNEIAKGKYQLFKLRHSPGDPAYWGKERIGLYPTRASYFESFQAVREATVTASSADWALRLFGLYELFYDLPLEGWFTPTDRIARFPPVQTALGFTTVQLEIANRKGTLQYPPNCRLLDLSPGEGSVVIGNHSGVLSEQILVDYMWKEVLLPHIM